MHTLRANTVGSAVALLLIPSITPSHMLELFIVVLFIQMLVENNSFKNYVSQFETTFVLNYLCIIILELITGWN